MLEVVTHRQVTLQVDTHGQEDVISSYTPSKRRCNYFTTRETLEVVMFHQKTLEVVMHCQEKLTHRQKDFASRCITSERRYK